ncbi:hypothetical protein [Oceanobacillus locisalsi]|uniref:Uncharacterized protein n=1 Tax=Oceanobacillus locisalsi TaxID=546107 RepID=A0ABW3NIE3_9BACI
MDTQLLFSDGNLSGYSVIPDGPTYKLLLNKDNVTLLDLNITIASIADISTGVNENNVYEWLWGKGNDILENNNDIEYPIKIVVDSNCVNNGELTVPWKNLIVEKQQ